MAENKKAFVVYTDWKKYIDDLNDTQIGKWTRWMFEYCNDKWKDKNDEIEYPKDTAVKMLCLLTKDILKRDLKKYEEKKNRLLKNGKQYRTDIDTKSNRNQTDINTDIGTDIDTEIETVNSNKLLVNSNKLLEESKDSNIKENNTTTYSSVKEKPSTTRFYPPTLEEVKAYCEERKNLVDYERWFDFYQSKGWMVGKNKMKDWKAAIRTWEKEAGFKEDDVYGNFRMAGETEEEDKARIEACQNGGFRKL